MHTSGSHFVVSCSSTKLAILRDDKTDQKRNMWIAVAPRLQIASAKRHHFNT